MPIARLLVVGRRTNRHHLKLRLLKEGLKENRCEQCGITEWRGKPLSMQLHHVNGDGSDNRLANIIFPCASCTARPTRTGGGTGTGAGNRPRPEPPTRSLNAQAVPEPVANLRRQ